MPHGTLDYLFISVFSLVGVGVVGFCFGVILDRNNATPQQKIEDGIDVVSTVPGVTATAENLLLRRQAKLRRAERRSLMQCLVGLVLMLATGTIIVYVDGGDIHDPRHQDNDTHVDVTVAQAFYFACITVTTIGSVFPCVVRGTN